MSTNNDYKHMSLLNQSKYLETLVYITYFLKVYCNIHFPYLTITRLSLFSFYYCYTSCSKKFFFHFLLTGPTPHINFGGKVGSLARSTICRPDKFYI